MYRERETEKERIERYQRCGIEEREDNRRERGQWERETERERERERDGEEREMETTREIDRLP